MGTTSPARPAIADVVRQHVEDVAILHTSRTALMTAPHARVFNLMRFDQRLAAHLDGVGIAAEQGWELCSAALESLTAGALFAATTRAILDRRQDRLEHLFALAHSDAEASKGLVSAFGWVEAADLRGIVAALLASPDALQRYAGVASSAMHRVDPGLLSARLLESAEPTVRRRALRTVGELGKREFLSVIATAIDDEDPGCRFWAAWSAVLLGDRNNALEYLKAAALTERPLQSRALQLVVQATSMADAHALLQQLAQDPARVRTLIKGAGLSGDLTYIPWLLGHMGDEKLARLAGEAFTLMTGADLALLDLERSPPENLDAGPNDDPEDPNVDMDADEDLPWPDQKLVQAWWARHGTRFTHGTRHFVGAPVSRNHCIDVLKNGYQRQRIAAAYHLCLLNPGTALFEWRAPAWRQQRELAQMA